MPTVHACMSVSVYVWFCVYVGSESTLVHICNFLPLLKDVINQMNETVINHKAWHPDKEGYTVLKSTKMDCLNERCSDSIGKLTEIKKRVRGKERERGQTMNRWHLRKADLCWPVRESAVSQWSRVKRGMKASEWASAGVRVPCIPWAANLPVNSLSPRPASPVWKAAALAVECVLQHIGRQSGCEACQMKVHSAQTHTKPSLPLSFWHSAPCMNSAGLNLRQKRKIKSCAAYLFGEHSIVMKQFDISHNLYIPPCHSKEELRLFCHVSN